jgi:hypothetical protein
VIEGGGDMFVFAAFLKKKSFFFCIFRSVIKNKK